MISTSSSRKNTRSLLLSLAGLAFLCSPIRAESARESKVLDPETISTIAKKMGTEGSLKNDVYTIVVPRVDLDLHTESGTIPIAAGIESNFHFYKCPCGKTNVVGQLVVAEYESNDVIDALRKDLHVKIASVSPMLMEEKPRLLVVRFQGEGAAEELAKSLRAALDWTGDARMKSRPVQK